MKQPAIYSRRRFLSASTVSVALSGCIGDSQNEASDDGDDGSEPNDAVVGDDDAREVDNENDGEDETTDEDENQEHHSTGLTPLTDGDGETYQGYPVSLYADGSNRPPDHHRDTVERRLAEVRPRDDSGSPAVDGQIGMISIGVSNTEEEFGKFMEIASDEHQIADHVTLVNGAQGGEDAMRWARGSGPWIEAKNRVEHSPLTAEQIQVAWVKQTLAWPHRSGEFPVHAHELRDYLVTIVEDVNEHFPNLSVIYLSSRTYGGYDMIQLSPEPYAYEGGYSVQSAIQRQIDGHEGLSADPEQGEPDVPVMLWGPYLWADGTRGREIDDLVWERDDFWASDGVHPSGSGRQKVADLLLEYFTTNPLATPWFVDEDTDS